MDHRPAPGVPGHCAATPAVRVLPRRRLHRGASRRAAQPAVEGHRPRRQEDHHHRLDGCDRGERVNGTTKSGRTRVVSIDDETVAVLRQRKADQAAEQLKAGDSWRGTKDGYVFTTGWGEPIYPDTVTSLMTKLIRASKQLPHARLHDLRHLHATTLLLSGVPVHVVAARLGPRRPGYHPPRLRPRHPQRRGRRRGHFRRCGQCGLLANPLARKALPRSERGSELGAAYRNRTDDLRITSASL